MKKVFFFLLVTAVTAGFLDLRFDKSQATIASTLVPCRGRNVIWNGSQCKTISYQGETAIVGLDSPINSRAELEEIEKNFVRRSFDNFPEELFKPDARDEAKEIQNIRLANFDPIGTDYPRTIEFLLNADAKEKMDQESAKIGADYITTLQKQVETMNQILQNSLPKINRKAILKRVIIVSSNVLSRAGGNWHVRNDKNFSWWANDELNGAKGDIPYDIDSRWALTDDFADWLIEAGARYNNVLIDYGMLHELVHHLPVGDNYVYNPAARRGLFLPQPTGKEVHFTSLSFMSNDHMTDTRAMKLTAPSSYHILYYWKKNPTQIRTAQDNPYSDQEINIYGNFLFNTLTLKLASLPTSVDGCSYYKRDDNGLMYPSDDRVSITFENNDCTLVLSKDQQQRAWPGGYIGLHKGEVVFPIFFPRNLMDTFYWSEDLGSTAAQDSFTFVMTATNNLAPALDFYTARVNSTSGDIDITSPLFFYMEVVPVAEIPSSAILQGAIDELNNRYIVDYKFGLQVKGAVAISGSDAQGPNRFTKVECPGQLYKSDPALNVNNPAIGDAKWDCSPGFYFEYDPSVAQLSSGLQTFTITPPPGYRCAWYGIGGERTSESFNDCTITVTVPPESENLFLWFFLEPEESVFSLENNVSGFAWSENIGWISFNCTNTGSCAAVNYGVNINPDSEEFSGYAWSEHIGWVSFNRADTGNPPEQPYRGGGLNYIAKANLETGEVTGWARALSFGADWDGWIKLNDASYGVSINTGNGDFSGYGWSDEIIGWIHFSGANYKVTTSLSFNRPPSANVIDETWNHCSIQGRSIPVFSWVYSDPDSDPQAAYEIEVDSNSSFLSPKFNHLVTGGSTAYALDLAQDDDSDWISELLWNTTYFWRVRVQDSYGNWSDWTNSDQFKTPFHAYPWPDFDWAPAEPSQGEIVIFNPDISVLYGGASISSYLWTIAQGESAFVDETEPSSQYPHIIFNSTNNQIQLRITDSSGYTCQTSPRTVMAHLPLPEYREAPPATWSF